MNGLNGALRYPCRLGASVVILIGLLVTVAHGDDRVVLIGGDTLRGRVVEQTAESLTLDHAVLGLITLERSKVEAVVLEIRVREPTSVDTITPEGEETVTPQAQVDAEAIEEFPWNLRLEAGFNGSEGRTEKLDGRLNFVAGRETDRIRFKYHALYRTASSRGDRTLNRLETGAINDWLFPDSPWFTFLQGRYELDEFSTYDYRVSGAGGVGYEFFNTDELMLIGRLGGGASAEFGGPRDGDTIPEAFGAVDFRKLITETTTINAGAEWYPDLDEFGDYRAILSASIETKLSPGGPMSLKFGVRDEIEELSNSTQDDLLEYFGLLVWDF